MIYQEIIKTIRQIELRTNRFAAGPLFQPSAQFGGMARAMKDRNDTDKSGFDVETDAVFAVNFDPCFANRLANEPKAFGILKDALESRVKLGFKADSQARLLAVIPCNRLLKFNPGFSRENYFPAQARLLFVRLLSSSRTFSHVIPFSGWRRSFSARCSNSAICSGVNSSSNSSRIRWRTSQRSSKGNRRNRSRISVALIVRALSC